MYLTMQCAGCSSTMLCRHVEACCLPCSRSAPIGESIGRKTDTSGKFLTSDEDEPKAAPTGELSGQPDAEVSSDDDDSEPADEEAARAAERWARVRGLAGPEASSSSGKEDSSAGEDSSEPESEAEVRLCERQSS